MSNANAIVFVGLSNAHEGQRLIPLFHTAVVIAADETAKCKLGVSSFISYDGQVNYAGAMANRFENLRDWSKSFPFDGTD